MSQILFVRLEASVLVCSPVQVELGGLTVGAKKVNTRFYCIFFFFFFSHSVSMCLHQADSIMAAGVGAYVKRTWSHPRTDKQ